MPFLQGFNRSTPSPKTQFVCPSWTALNTPAQFSTRSISFSNLPTPLSSLVVYTVQTAVLVQLLDAPTCPCFRADWFPLNALGRSYWTYKHVSFLRVDYACTTVSAVKEGALELSEYFTATFTKCLGFHSKIWGKSTVNALWIVFLQIWPCFH